MTNEPSQQAGESGRARPTLRVWLVTDKPDGKPEWMELAGLWPTKTGKGYSGALRQPVAATAGRIVILPAASNPAKEG